MRVLIAEDHANFAESLRWILSNDDRFEVVGRARNGEEAVEMAERYAPDVILMDLEMPIMDGLEATRRIRQGTSARVVMHTGSDARATEARARLAGAWGYLPKGTRSTDLIATLFAAGSAA